MRQFCLALMIALLGTTSAYAVSTSWSSASASWTAANGTFQTGFGATTTASFSVGVVFDVADLSTFTSSTLLLSVRNNNSVATDADRNTGPSFEVWGDGKIRTKASNAASVTSGTGFTYNNSYASGNNKATEYIGTADFASLLHTGENAIGLTLELFQNASSEKCTTYTLYLNGTKVVTSTHTAIGATVYDYKNLATLTGAEVYYMAGIASQADINSLPEPTVLALLALGVAGVALRRKVA